MHRDGTTWVIAGVSGAGGGPPQGPVGRFKPKHPRARVATAARMRGNGGATQVAAQRNSRSPHARRRAVRHEHNTTGHYSREARTGYA